MGPCIIQPFHDPHGVACCCIHDTMSLHHKVRLVSLPLPEGEDAAHCWQVARIAVGEAHIPGWSSMRSDIHPTMFVHQPEGGADRSELLANH